MSASHCDRQVDLGRPALIGPLLRHVDPVSATVWVETDRACEVEVLGRRSRTFRVGGHHYALVLVEGLEGVGAADLWPLATRAARTA